MNFQYVDFVAWFHLIYFGVFLPIGSLRLRSKLAGSSASSYKVKTQFSARAVTLLLLAIFSLAVAWRERIDLFPRAFPSVTALVAGIAMYLICVGLMAPKWRAAVEKRDRIAWLFMPGTRVDFAWWVVICVLAGAGEEISWRCVQTTLLTWALGSYWLGALLSAISFAAAHAVQGKRSVVIIIAFALGFQGLVWLAGSPYLAIAVHIAYDITAGLAYARLGRKFGFRPLEARL